MFNEEKPEAEEPGRRTADFKANILLVDDLPQNLLVLEAVLGELGQNLVMANSGEEALWRLREQDFAVVLLDVQMPHMDGFETAEMIRAYPPARNTPIIFLTAIHQTDAGIRRGYGLDAVDYLFKPIQPQILRAKVRTFVALAQQAADLRHAWQAREQQRLEREQEQRKAAALERKLETLRRAEHCLQTVLDALPVCVAVLDDDGRVVTANAAWQRGYAHNPLVGPDRAVGIDYLEACRATCPGDWEATPLLLEGIRAVLRGERQAFTHEYTTPRDARRLRTSVSRLADGEIGRVVVMHEEMTAPPEQSQLMIVPGQATAIMHMPAT